MNATPPRMSFSKEELEHQIANARSAKEAQRWLCLWLWWCAGYSVRETAQVLGLSESSVHRIRRRFKEGQLREENARLLSREEGAPLLFSFLRQKREDARALEKLQTSYEQRVGQPVSQERLRLFLAQFGVLWWG